MKTQMKTKLNILLVLLVSVTLVVSLTPDVFDKADDQPVGDVLASRVRPQPYNKTGLLPMSIYGCPLCLRVYTGTLRSTFTISNPTGVSGFNNYHLVNFDQRVTSQSPTTLEIEITTRRYVDTRAPYPVNTTTLPEDIREFLLPYPGWIQSDDPEIVAKAVELVSGATRQAEALDAVQAWVRGNIVYDDTHSLPNNASAVFRNRSGVCAGFATLTVALLRAAGIPARYQEGCVVSDFDDGNYGWAVGEEGGWHAWAELYYPDVGWVAVDPQVTTNYLDTGHIVSGFDQCEEEGTIISLTDYTEHAMKSGYLYSLRTPYEESPREYLYVANVSTWDRHPLRVVPTSPSVLVSIQDPTDTLDLQVEDLSCGSPDWQISTQAPWLTPSIATGATAGIAHFTVDASGMGVGVYTSPMTVYAKPDPWPGITSRTITATLRIIDAAHQCYFPLVEKE